MLLAFVMLAVEEAEAEPSKTAFYIAGIALACWAVILAFMGLRSATFPNGQGGARAVMATSAVLVAAAMITAVATA